MRKRAFVLVLLGLLFTATMMIFVSAVAAQGNCVDPKTGAQVNCPQGPAGPVDSGKGDGRKKRTPTPVKATKTPTSVPNIPENNPIPYPYPYPSNVGPVLPTITPPVGICVFCDRPWLWGIIGIVASLGVVGFMFFFFRRPFSLGPGGSNPFPSGGPNLTVTTPGEHEILPAIQKGNANATVTVHDVGEDGGGVNLPGGGSS